MGDDVYGLFVVDRVQNKESIEPKGESKIYSTNTRKRENEIHTASALIPK